MCKQMTDVYLLRLHSNAWKHFTVYKQMIKIELFVLDRNTFNCVQKNMTFSIEYIFINLYRI